MRIFVGNLAFTTTEAELRQLFASYGSVEPAQIITDGRPAVRAALALSRCRTPERHRPPSPDCRGHRSGDEP
jgi:RNA recognition motif-containing protein